MDELLGSAQIRAIEHAAMQDGSVTGQMLMERAGQGVLDAALAHWPGLAARPGRAVVLCGPGNNGGDGFVVARLLHGRGWQVSVYLLGAPERLPPDAAAMHAGWRALGPVHPLSAFDPDAPPPGLLVDALFGAGLSRPVEGIGGIAALTARMCAADGHVLAVDAPSGLCLDSGRVLGAHALKADLTVSFHRWRPGHYLAEGPAHCGALTLADIGLPAPVEVLARLVAPAPARLAKAAAAHKYSHGHALVLAGGPGQGGAARLAARAALRVGAGAVTLGCPAPALPENAARLEAVMLRVIGDAPGLAAALEDRRLSALCLGPGLGLGERTQALVTAACASGRPAVLDADALSVFAGDPAQLFARLHAGCVLTPHGGEFARLFPDLAAQLTDPAESGPAISKLDVTRAAAARSGAVVLFKGPDTVIAEPGGRVWLHAAAYARAVPWLATAGAGDVLAGLIAGLLARGLAPAEAVAQAAWLHAEAARAFGPGLIAEDLPGALPGVLARVLGTARDAPGHTP